MKASDYRAAARQTLSGNWKPAVVAGIVYLVIVTWLSCITSILTKSDPHGFSWLNSVNSIYSILVVLPFGFAFILAFYNFAKDSSDNRLASNVFTLFAANYRKGLVSMLLLALIVTLISIIPMIAAAVIAVIPFASEIGELRYIIEDGNINPSDFDSMIAFVKFMLVLFPLIFIASIPALVYAYRVCLFPVLLAENPEMGIRESFKRSAEIMRGHKWQIFCLDFSFIGWFILSILTCGIGLLWVIPYQQTAHSHFYHEMLKSNDE